MFINDLNSITNNKRDETTMDLETVVGGTREARASAREKSATDYIREAVVEYEQ